jgi:uncharacterized protein YjbI with pentapeptide repeats
MNEFQNFDNEEFEHEFNEVDAIFDEIEAELESEFEGLASELEEEFDVHIEFPDELRQQQQELHKLHEEMRTRMSTEKNLRREDIRAMKAELRARKREVRDRLREVRHRARDAAREQGRKGKRGRTFSFNIGDKDVRMHITPPVPPIPPVPPTPITPPTFVMGRIEMFDDDELKALDSKAIAKLLARLAAFIKSTEHTAMSGSAANDVMADTIAEKYQTLYQHAVELLPNDDYIKEDVKITAKSDNAVTKVQMVLFSARQLHDYLRDILRQTHRNAPTDFGDWSQMGRRLKDEIMSITKNAIQRATSNFDVNVDYDIEVDGKRYSNRSGVDMPGANLAGKEFNDEDLRGANFMGANLEGCSFASADLRKANLSGANLKGAVLNDANLEHANLSGIRAGNAQFASANMEDTNLTGANLKGAVLNDANLEDANLSGANLSEVEAANANFSDANLSGALLTGAHLNDATLDEANLNSANLTKATLNSATLNDANLRHANLTGAQLVDAGLESANLTGAVITDANFTSANLEDAIMPDGRRYRDGDDLAAFGAIDENNPRTAKFKNVTVPGAGRPDNLAELEDMRGANLRGQDLRSHDFSHQDMSGVVLTEAQLNKANFMGATLVGAFFIGANLSNAGLQDANLIGANLAGANLSQADLSGANLKNANIGGANVTNAKLEGATLPDGSTYSDSSDLSQFGAITRIV